MDKPTDKEGAGAKQNALQYIFTRWRGGKNGRLLLTMCLAGHKWADLEMVGSVFWGCGDQGELIRW